VPRDHFIIIITEKVEADMDLKTCPECGCRQSGGAATIYAEAAYFDGDHCAHVAAWEDHRRLQRIRAQARLVIERRTRSRARG